MPNPGQLMIFFRKSHIDSSKNPDLKRKSQVDTKLSECFYYLPYLGICNQSQNVLVNILPIPGVTNPDRCMSCIS